MAKTPRSGDVVYFYIGDGDSQLEYVAIILGVEDERVGRCWLRIYDKIDPTMDFHQATYWSDKPKSGHWSYR